MYIGWAKAIVEIKPRPVAKAGCPYIPQPGVAGIKATDSSLPITVLIVIRKRMARIAARTSACSQRLLQAEANNPAAKAQHIALRLIMTERIASLQLRPPSRNGIVATGNTASHKVIARRP